MDPSASLRLGLSAGLILLVPSLVGLTVKAPETPKPEPGKAVLTLDFDSGDRWGDAAGSRRLLAVRSVGAAPDLPTRLVSASGRNVATVQKAADCSGATSYDTGLPGEEAIWCLSLALPRAGAEVKGTVKGAAAEVDLTVRNRHGLLLPLLIALAGLLGGALALLWPPLLGAVNRRSALGHQLRENDLAAAAVKIKDLRAWAERERRSGVPDEDLLPLVTQLRRDDPARAGALRQDLHDQLTQEQFSTGQPIVRAAMAEAARSTHLVHDFLGSDNKPATHPAETYAAAMLRLNAAKRRLDTATGRFGSMNQTDRERLTPQLQGCRAFLDRAEITDLEALDQRVAALQYEIDKVSGVVPAAAGATGQTLPLLLNVPTVVPSVARWLTVSTVVVIIALGLAALWASVYLPTPTFGSAVDYYKLFAAAAGSSAVAAAVSALDGRGSSS